MNIKNVLKLLLLPLLLPLFSLPPAIYHAYAGRAGADEGMWLPLLLQNNQEEMQKLGLKLTSEQIYSINNSSLKDAIVSFGGFCTASIISKDGLVLTNHHCGYEVIQNHSSVENDYLTDGFWATSRAEEKPNPGLTVTFLVRIEDVTEKILSELNDDMDPAERDEKIYMLSNSIAAEATEGTHYHARVSEMFAGNEYYLFVKETFRDVRLVGAPPESIGKFGGDTDNWMWPRHTGDFSLFRVYTGPDGKPAEYSEKNIPLKPQHYLPVSIKGIDPGSFAMILGFPGSTQRYKTSYGIRLLMEQSNPTRIKIRGEILKIMRNDMDESDEIRLKYSSQFARVSNYHKYFIGQDKGFIRMNTVSVKESEENNFQKWADENQERKAKYGQVLSDIKNSYDNLKGYNMARDYLNELLFSAAGVLKMPYLFSDLYKALIKNKGDLQAVKPNLTRAKAQTEKHFKDYHLPTDKKIFTKVLRMYYEDMPPALNLGIFNLIEKKYKNDFSRFADVVFSKSMLTSAEKVNNFFEKPSLKLLNKDLGFQTMQSILLSYRNVILPNSQKDRDKLREAQRQYIAGLREMYADKNFYPDANFTMRLTYGKVIKYDPKDAVHYDYATTIEGIIEKRDPYDPEFFVPDKLLELYNEKDYGNYANNGTLNICFITDNDITGGNSGSPVINGDGELIGIAFDNNWEGMTGDLAYDPNMKRCINVDIRYVLFLIDKFAGAGYLVEEMTVVE
ncbi:MAG: S46 family peptidase [Cytophagales bacterium]|nr:S46 family peptidase [Cytophagales bacterium]